MLEFQQLKSDVNEKKNTINPDTQQPFIDSLDDEQRSQLAMHEETIDKKIEECNNLLIETEDELKTDKIMEELSKLGRIVIDYKIIKQKDIPRHLVAALLQN
jgi:hypothetical protein